MAIFQSKWRACLTLAILSFSGSLHAGWSANVGATTDYLFRTHSQTQGKLAVFGGVDYQHDSGFYLGTWVTNVDFGIAGFDPSIEVDFYLGYKGVATLDEIFGYSVSYTRYMYPSANLNNRDYGELLFDFNVTDFIFGLSTTIDTQGQKGAPNEVGDWHYYLGYDGDYDNGWGFSIILGRQTFAINASLEHRREDPTRYWYWHLTTSKSTRYGDFVIGLSQSLRNRYLPGVSRSEDTKIRPSIAWVLYF